MEMREAEDSNFIINCLQDSELSNSEEQEASLNQESAC